MRTLDFEALALELMDASHPKEKRRPPTEPEKYEHVKDGTLRFLFEHDCLASPAQLIEFFGFSHARLTKILGDLEGEGYVLRSSDPADRRRVIVHLTDKGLERTVGKRKEMLDRMVEILEYLGEEDAVHFVRIMKKLTAQALPPCGM